MLGTESDTDFREILSRCIVDGLEARRLIARKASTSPRLKEPAPCLNSHWAVLSEFVDDVDSSELEEFAPWKVSLTLWKPYMLSWRTKDEGLVCLKYCDRTLENSSPGEMTNESFDGVHEMRCLMESSSSME